MAPPTPKSRLGIVSPGIGKIAGAITTLLIGVVALFFNRSLGQSLLAMALMFGIWGAYTIYRGIHAPVKNVACPKCGHRNEVLTDVKDFACANCHQAIKLVRKPS